MFRDYSSFVAALHSIETDPGNVVRTEYHNWPEQLKTAHTNPPALSYKLSKIELESILSTNNWYRRYRDWINQKVFCVPDEIIHYAVNSKEDLFPKLGLVSWKESVGFITIPGGDAAELMIAGLFNNINNRMAAILHAYVIAKEEPYFYWFPYLDYKQSLEIRVISENRCLAISKYSEQILKRNDVDSSFLKTEMKRFCSELEMDNLIFDLSFNFNTHEIKLVEINPINRSFQQHI